MSTSRPPQLALFLFDRLGVGSQHEALVGDLLEEYERRRSRTWFWRQTMVVLVVSCWIDLRQHKWLAFRALLVGWTAFVIGADIANALTRETRGFYLGSPHLAGIAFPYTAFACCGWLVARSHRRSPSAFMLFATTVMIFEYGFAAIMLANAPAGREAVRGEWILLLALIGRPLALFAGALGGAKARPLHTHAQL